MPYNITPEAPYQPLLDTQQLTILIPDSGSRGHALAWNIAQSDRAGRVFVAPGNAGTALEGGKIENVAISPLEVRRLAAWAVENDVHLLYSGMEDPLAAGLVNEFAAVGIPAFGPTQAAARVESSKLYAKNLMDQYGIPTARYDRFGDQTAGLRHLDTLQEGDFPIVVKDSNLRQGKGVTICYTPDEAAAAIGEMPGEYLIEDYLDGQEISLHAASGLNQDGEPVYAMLDAAQDYKQASDGDQGPNTGGMGVVTPLPWLSRTRVDRAGEIFVKPMLRALAEAGNPFVGLLYPGLSLTTKGPRAVEYNGRWGGPEGESYALSLETNMLDIALAAVTRRLDGMHIVQRPGFAANVVVAAPGYPGEYKKGMQVTGIEHAEEVPGTKVFHSGTRLGSEGQILAAGGRVVTVAAFDPEYDRALAAANEAASRIVVEGGSHRRTDIGRRAVPQVVGL